MTLVGSIYNSLCNNITQERHRGSMELLLAPKSVREGRGKAWLLNPDRQTSELPTSCRFFCRFNFTLIYHPGSRITKPDALSCQFTTDNTGSEPGSIVPSICTVATLSWEIESRMGQAQRNQPDPGNGPENCSVCSGSCSL